MAKKKPVASVKPPVFTKPFNSGGYVSDGDRISIEHDGFTITATIYSDDDSEPPWSREDGHGPVSEWTTRDKKPGERVLSSDRQSHRYYDYAEAIEIAKRDRWDSKPFGTGTPGERAARAVEVDFKALKAWCDDEWSYYGVAVTVSKSGIQLTGKYDHAVWGIDGNYPDSDNSHFLEVANEQVEEALEAARAKIAALCSK